MGLLLSGKNPAALKTAERQTFTATAGQTVFTTYGYTVGDIDVYLNGLKLVDAEDYYATNGTTIVLNAAANAGDSLAVTFYNQFLAANTYTKAESDSRYIGTTSTTPMQTYLRTPNYGISSYSDSAFSALEASVGQGSNGVGVKAWGRSMATSGGDIHYTSDTRGAGGGHRFYGYNGTTVTNFGGFDSLGRYTYPQQPYILCRNWISSNGMYNLQQISSRGGLSVGSANGYNAIYAPLTGVYLLAFNGITADSSGRYDINIYKNNSGILSSLNEANASGYHYRTISQALYLTANDYISLKLEAGTAYYTSSGSSYDWGNFSMTFLG